MADVPQNKSALLVDPSLVSRMIRVIERVEADTGGPLGKDRKTRTGSINQFVLVTSTTTTDSLYPCTIQIWDEVAGSWTSYADAWLKGPTGTEAFAVDYRVYARLAGEKASDGKSIWIAASSSAAATALDECCEGFFGSDLDCCCEIFGAPCACGCSGGGTGNDMCPSCFSAHAGWTDSAGNTWSVGAGGGATVFWCMPGQPMPPSGPAPGLNPWGGITTQWAQHNGIGSGLPQQCWGWYPVDGVGGGVQVPIGGGDMPQFPPSQPRPPAGGGMMPRPPGGGFIGQPGPGGGGAGGGGGGFSVPIPVGPGGPIQLTKPPLPPLRPSPPLFRGTAAQEMVTSFGDGLSFGGVYSGSEVYVYPEQGGSTDNLGTIAAPALSVDQNDYAPGSCSVLQLTTDNLGVVNITGISMGQVDGQQLFIQNAGGIDNIVFQVADAGSSVGNRIVNNPSNSTTDITLAPGAMMLLKYGVDTWYKL